MILIPIAHAGHTLVLVPVFAPPLAIMLGLLVLVVRDRLRAHR